MPWQPWSKLRRPWRLLSLARPEASWAHALTHLLHDVGRPWARASKITTFPIPNPRFETQRPSSSDIGKISSIVLFCRETTQSNRSRVFSHYFMQQRKVNDTQTQTESQTHTNKHCECLSLFPFPHDCIFTVWSDWSTSHVMKLELRMIQLL